MNAGNAPEASEWMVVDRSDFQDLNKTVGEIRPTKGKPIAVGIGVAVGTALTASLVALLVFHTPYWSLAPIGGGAIGLGMLAGGATYGYQRYQFRKIYTGIVSYSNSLTPRKPPPTKSYSPEYTGL